MGGVFFFLSDLLLKSAFYMRHPCLAHVLFLRFISGEKPLREGALQLPAVFVLFVFMRDQCYETCLNAPQLIASSPAS